MEIKINTAEQTGYASLHAKLKDKRQRMQAINVH